MIEKDPWLDRVKDLEKRGNKKTHGASFFMAANIPEEKTLARGEGEPNVEGRSHRGADDDIGISPRGSGHRVGMRQKNGAARPGMKRKENEI